MPGFEDSALIVLLALLLFGPKKLPELARQFGKLMADFRRASSEFRTQMEDELRISEQAERQKKIAAETAATPAGNPDTTPAADPPQDGQSEYADQDLPPHESSLDYLSDSMYESVPESPPHSSPDDPWQSPLDSAPDSTPETPLESTAHSTPQPASSPLPIATSGEMSILPPSTGLPTPHSASDHLSDAAPAHQESSETEAMHG